MRSCIVGCGAIAPIHATAICDREDTVLSGCCDIEEEKGRKFAKTFETHFYTDLEDLLQKEKPDVLHICTPHNLHLPMAKMAASYGVHVFSEKPPVISAEQVEELLDVEKSVRVGICFQNRYNGANRYIRNLLDEGALGTLLGGRGEVFWKRDAAYYTDGSWRGTKKREGGGVLINQAIHTLDLLVYFLGHPVSVQAKASNYTLHDVIEVEDTLEAYIQFEKATAMFFATNAYIKDAPVAVEIIGDKSSVYTSGNKVVLSENREEKQLSFSTKNGGGKDYWGASHRDCIFDFYDSIREGRPFLNSFTQVLPTTRLMLAAYASAAENGKKIII